jgi:SagB-type dehydrogenase family enzyme
MRYDTNFQLLNFTEMKRLIAFFTVLCLTTASLLAQDLQEIKLNNPNKSRGSALMKALSDRQSIREYAARDLSLQDLSDLIWAANGVNRPDGRRTAPSARNCQEIDVYMINKDGAYLYDPAGHTLKPVAKGDFKKAVAANQDYVTTAPVILVLVANLEKLGDPTHEGNRSTAAMDAGIVSQNINIFCAAVGLATVPRGIMNKDELKTILKLTDNQLLLLNNPVGYPKQ